ncbi:MAG: 2-phospho-L-lactate guanylyltransferase [Actinomycetota bacterium]
MRPWWVIVPVRSGPGAKTRLSTLTAPKRATVALAFAHDTISAALACPEVAGVIVVSDDAAREKLQIPGVAYAVDPGNGLNRALTAGAAIAPDGAGVVALMSDLPALTPDELGRALLQARESPRSFVCDSEGIGTTLLASSDPTALDPHFGERSRAAHAASGAVEIESEGLPRLRRDVDSEVALWDARRLGVGAATAKALA